MVERHRTDGGEYIDVVLLGAEAEILFVVEEVGGGEAFERNSQG